MQYKISAPIRIRYLELSKTSGITDLTLIVQPPSGGELSPITMTEVDGQGIYESSFTPTSVGWYWVRIKSTSYPLNIYSKSYYVGTTDDPNPAQEEGKLTSIDTKLGEVQASPIQYTLLDRLKSIYDKLNDVFSNGLARIKIWNGTTEVGVTSTGRLKVDVSQTDYTAKSISEIVDIIIPTSADYWILNLINKSGIIDEIHIISNDINFLFVINVDGTNYFNEKGNDLKNQYLLDTGTGLKCKHIETSTGKDFHWDLPIYFQNSIQIGLYTATTGKKLTAYIISYREKI